MQLLKLGVLLRTRLRHLPYGDQGIFVAHNTFRSTSKVALICSPEQLHVA